MNTKQNHKTQICNQNPIMARLAQFALLMLPMTVIQPASASSDMSLPSQPQSISVTQTVTSDEQSAQTAQYGNTLSELQISQLDAQRVKQAEQQASFEEKGEARTIREPLTREKLTREQIVQAHIDKATQGNLDLAKSGSSKQFANGIYRDFYIYDAYSRLFVDNDYDGFYQTFSVTFDADVQGYYVNERADVFAELYLSRNGGPWEHYYTTDIFSIYGNATDDDFEVLTTLDYGYPTDHYDVLIDLYEVGYGDIVATVSSYDFDSLYALPLESSDRDDIYIDEDYHGASLSLGLLLLLFSLLALRRFKSDPTKS
ncbi:choice-of-anchor H family protein [Shewanella schlegeliana]|uniref:Choice-of-anchor H family protein n=1 Tax=Shewanella schlegeliana TaxID=190308 RepID=A0ABS1SYK2_9GAMM|nr:choice-of-anchor H family protein [Shewanella schlegeliana]MBL4913479.1 choice-of-anchor H family protein [Shewanella schlegeliana]MCL1108369.1 choice-of-anchor H family protein [Shewanella schlegeliana]GIU28990.1 GlyGly-CTERM sorting domain-containing protein [Shewanella schlegeliana]